MGTIQRVVPNGAHSTEQIGRRSFIKHICLDRISHFLAAVFGHKAGHTEIAARFRNNARPRALDGKFTYGDLFANLFAATNRAEFKREAIDWAKAREKAKAPCALRLLQVGDTAVAPSRQGVSRSNDQKCRPPNFSCRTTRASGRQ